MHATSRHARRALLVVAFLALALAVGSILTPNSAGRSGSTASAFTVDTTTMRADGTAQAAAADGDLVGWLDGQAEAEWYAGVAEADRQAAALRTSRSANPSTGTEVRTGVVARGSQYADAAECTRAHEGWYEANTGNNYYGAYQFNLGTWRNTVRAMGRDDLVDVLPSDASPADQDAAFWYLWGGGAGASHWGYRCMEYAG